MNNSEFPKRKHPRLKNYDYGSDGSYFLTICTIDKKCILGYIPQRTNINDAPKTVLSDIGKTVEKYIFKIGEVYSEISVDNYVIMPNHIHLLLTIDKNGNKNSRDNIPGVVKAFKRVCARDIGYQIWQESYFDEIIKSESHLQNVWNYIEFNECKWENDDYFQL